VREVGSERESMREEERENKRCFSELSTGLPVEKTEMQYPRYPHSGGLLPPF
jgi:hypothetical protein